MSTRSAICIEDAPDKIRGIYCHFDGYPEHVGTTLADHYNSRDQAESLLSLGDLSSLGKRIAPDPGEPHSYDDAAQGVTVAYHRDRGERLRPAAEGVSWEDVAKEMGVSYCYLWRDGAGWLCAEMYADDLALIPVEDMLKERELEAGVAE